MFQNTWLLGRFDRFLDWFFGGCFGFKVVFDLAEQFIVAHLFDRFDGFGRLRLAVFFGILGLVRSGDALTLLKSLDLSGGVDQDFLAREEGMAIGTQLRPHILARAKRLNFVAAGQAGDGDGAELGVQIFFHRIEDN